MVIDLRRSIWLTESLAGESMTAATSPLRGYHLAHRRHNHHHHHHYHHHHQHGSTTATEQGGQRISLFAASQPPFSRRSGALPSAVAHGHSYCQVCQATPRPHHHFRCCGARRENVGEGL